MDTTDGKVKDHHVAWADRIGLNKQWARDIQACGEAFGSPMYPTMVRRFRCNIPNIKNGPQLKDYIDEYFNIDLKEWRTGSLVEWRTNNQQAAQNTAWLRQQAEEINKESYEYLYVFMIQLLEDYGFAFYESNIEEDEMQ